MGQPSLAKNFPRPPREIRRRHGGPTAFFTRVGAVLMTFVFFVLAAIVLRDTVVHYAGEDVTANVTRTWTTRGKRTHYHVAYNYRVNNNLYSADESVTRDEYQHLPANSAAPAKSIELFGHRTASLNLGTEGFVTKNAIFAIMSVVWAFISFALFRAAWLDPTRDRRALETGDPVPGTVTDKRTRRHKNSTKYYVRFRYTARPGESHDREIQTARFIFDAVFPNDPLIIFLDPALPKRGVPLELSEFEIVMR